MTLSRSKTCSHCSSGIGSSGIAAFSIGSSGCAVVFSVPERAICSCRSCCGAAGAVICSRGAAVGMPSANRRFSFASSSSIRATNASLLGLILRSLSFKSASSISARRLLLRLMALWVSCRVRIASIKAAGVKHAACFLYCSSVCGRQTISCSGLRAVAATSRLR